MMDNISIITSLLIPFIVLFVPKYLLTNSIQKHVGGWIELKDKFLNFLPFYNTYRIRQVMEGESPLYKGIAIAAIPVLLFLFFIRFVKYDVAGLQLIATVLILVYLVVAYVSEVYALYRLGDLFGKKAVMVTCFIPFVASFLMYPYVKTYVKEYEEELEGTFDGESE